MPYSKIIYTTFIALTAMAALLIVFPSLPIKGNYKIMAVLSGSMEPLIKTGGIVVVKPEADYRVGDVISFATAGGNKVSTTHRIVEVKTEGNKTAYVTKGDANSDTDAGETDRRNVIGKVIFSLPYVGYLFAFVRQPMGFVAAVIIPSTLVIFDEGKNIWSEMRPRKSSYRVFQRVNIRRSLHIPKIYKIKVREIM